MGYEIGTTSANMVTLASLGIPDPKGRFLPEAERVRLGNGKYKGLGSPVVIWEWGFLTQADRDALRTYCTGNSATVYIETITNNSTNTYATYTGLMHWPDGDENQDTYRRLGFSVEFTNLVIVV
jgi:hypothetical protein